MIFLIVALVLFILAALGVPAPPPRFNLTAAGLAFLTVALLLAGTGVR
jgi:hypothetical protein